MGIDGGSASPAVLTKKVLAAAYAPSYAIGELVLRKIGGIELTGRGLNKTAVKIGSEMVARRDVRTEAYLHQPLPRQHARPKTPIQLACVSIDGGRMQTRDEGVGKGVHRPHWRETKNALFLRMKSDRFACDPHPDLPACFEKTDPRKIFADAIGYFENNATRMDYPEYRRQGLPTTSAHMESLVKEINIRVKGTEKFWNDGASGEAILQIRAAALCEDDRLEVFLANRPGHPFHPNVPRHPPLAAAG